MKIINKLDYMTPNLYTEDYVNKLKEELKLAKENNLQLQQRIDKAIEYIETTNFWGLYDDTPMEEVKYGEELLEILKGIDSNE